MYPCFSTTKRWNYLKKMFFHDLKIGLKYPIGHGLNCHNRSIIEQYHTVQCSTVVVVIVIIVAAAAAAPCSLSNFRDRFESID